VVRMYGLIEGVLASINVESIAQGPYLRF